MNTAAKQRPTDVDREAEFQARLAEYEDLQEEYREGVRLRQQTMVLALGAVSFAVPVILSQTQNLPTGAVAMLLYAFTVVFSALVMVIASTTYQLGELADYLNRSVLPELNRLLGMSPQRAVMQYPMLRRNFKGFLSNFMSLMNSTGILLLVLFPATVSIVAAGYAMKMPVASAATVVLIVDLTSWVAPFAVIAWISYALAIVVVLSTLAYWALGSRLRALRVK